VDSRIAEYETTRDVISFTSILRKEGTDFILKYADDLYIEPTVDNLVYFLVELEEKAAYFYHRSKLTVAPCAEPSALS